MADAPVPLSPCGPVSVRRHTLVRRALRFWSAFRAGGRSDEVGLGLEPLGFWPDRCSSLTGRAGKPNSFDNYAFHTRYVPSTGGRITFRIKFTNFTGTRGKLYVSINKIDQNGAVLEPKVDKFDVYSLAGVTSEISVSLVALFEHSYALTGVLADSDAQAEIVEISVTGADSDEAYAARLQAAQRGFLSLPGQGMLADVIVPQTATLTSPISQMCTAAQMREGTYADVCGWLQEEPKFHRKQWEFVYILRSLEYHGVLRKGARGLGFGVGVEPLSSIFAAAGCEIVATDLPAHDDRAGVWNDTSQLGANVKQIFHERLCDEKLFFDRVTFRPVDMNKIPVDLAGFDFTWSSCAYEHLGSIDAGLDFFENSLKCLVPGGIAVHTTEMNLSSNSATLDKGNTVVFRRRDFERLAERLIVRGHQVFPITFDSGTEDLDYMIDLPPYRSDPHLKLALMRWVSTSFGLIVRKGTM